MTTTPTLWRGTSQVNSKDGGFAQTSSDIVALPDGGYLIVWEDRTLAGDIDMRGQRYDALGRKLGGELPIEVVTDSQTAPKLATFADGRVLVAFVDDFSDRDIWVDPLDPDLKHLYDPDPASNSHILRHSVERTSWFGEDASISILNNGAYVVAYTYMAGPPGTNDLDVYAQIMNPDGTKGALVRINTDGVNADSSEVATLRNGNFVTVYRHESDRINRPGDHDVLFQINTASGGLVSTNSVPGAADAADAFEPAVAALTGGGFAVAWTDASGDGSGQGIRMTVFDQSGTAIKSDIQVNSSESGDQNQADVIGLKDGGFLVAFDDDQAGVTRGQRFDASGNKVGGEFLIGQGVGGGGPHGVLLSDGRVAFALVQRGGGDQDVATVIFDPRGDLITGTNDGETLTSRRDGATVNGLGGNDHLFGFAGHDRLDGGDGNDVLKGGGGSDQLFGGADADMFVFGALGDSRNGAGHDVIEDFSHLDGDRIDLRLLDANTQKAGNQAFHLVGGAGHSESFAAYHHHHAKAQWAGALRIAANGLVQADVNGDGKPDFAIAVHGDHLVKGDFFL